jgi:hypothetical protein
VPWVLDLALGKELFAGQAVPSALCRELPLGTGFAEGNHPCAKSISLSAKLVNPVVFIEEGQNNNGQVWMIDVGVSGSGSF